MAAEINTLPIGLLSMLGLKEQGRNPDTLLGQVIPTLDLRDLYATQLQDNAAEVVSAATATGTFAVGAMKVPNNEIWYVQHFSVACNTSAVQTIDMAPIAKFLTLGMPLGIYQSAPINAELRCAASNVPFFARPGTEFGVGVKTLTGGPINVSLQAVFARLRV